MTLNTTFGVDPLTLGKYWWGAISKSVGRLHQILNLVSPILFVLLNTKLIVNRMCNLANT